MNRHLILILLLVISFHTYGQETNQLPGKWQICFGVTPYAEGGVMIYNSDKINLVEQLQAPYRFRFPRYFEFGTYLNYNPLKRFRISSGMELSYKNLTIWSNYPYVFDVGFSTRYYVEKSHNFFTTIPLSVNYKPIQKGRFNWWIGAGFVNSFLLFQKHVLPANYKREIQTTIYQNYLELSTTFELSKKSNENNSWYFQPLMRYAIVDYYNNRKYDIGKYPNVFPQRTMGFTIGYRKGIWDK